jgi:hypothetical protein
VRVVALALVVLGAAACRFTVGGSTEADLATGDVDMSDVGSSDMGTGGGDLAGAPDLATGSPDLLVTGVLTVARIDMPSTVSLSTEGLSDWTHYGIANASDVDRKSGVSPSITMANAGFLLKQWSFYTPSTTWTGGTPTASGDTTSGVYMNGAGSVFTFTAPADATARTLALYLTQYKSTCTLVAHLSDGSAPDFTMSTMAGGANIYHRFAINFRASRPGQTLTVTWKLTTDATGSGDVDAMAATYF